MHLAQLAAQAHTAPAEMAVDGPDEAPGYDELAAEGGLSELWETAPPAERPAETTAPVDGRPS